MRIWAALLLTCAGLAGCASRQGEAAYLSLSDAVVVIGKKGGWGDPYPPEVRDLPSEGRVVFSPDTGAAEFFGVPHEVRWVEPEDCIEILLKDGSGRVFRVAGERAREILRILKRRGRIEIFNEGMSEKMGLGGLGI
jgi:hypothetical protein